MNDRHEMIDVEIDYLERIDLYKKIKKQLQNELVLIEDQLNCSKDLQNDIDNELFLAQSEVNEIKKNILKEKMIFEKEMSNRARLRYINRTKLDFIEDLKEEMEASINKPSVAITRKQKILKQVREKDIENENPNVTLGEISQMLKNKKSHLKFELEGLKKRLLKLKVS